MLESSPMSENSSQGLIRTNADAPIHSAIQFWAEGSTRAETFERASKLRDKTQVVRGFFEFAGKHPGEATPATVYVKVSRISAFFKWLMADPLLGQHIRSNPAAQARPRRHPQPYQSESVKSLTDDEVNRLLTAVKMQADSGSIVGRRDYALLLFFFLTGLRRNEVISLRGRDLDLKGGKFVIRYRRKGGKFVGRGVDEHGAFEALEDYLRAAKREDVLGSERPLDEARPGGQARSPALVALLRRQSEGLCRGRGYRGDPHSPDASHVRADRGRRDGELPGDAGGARPRERGDDARLRAAHYSQGG
jgi:integrase